MKKETSKDIPVEEKIKTQDDVEEEKEEPGIDFMELLKNPLVGQLLESGKDLFKKEKADPNVCEITIRAPSEVVLKLFNLSE